MFVSLAKAAIVLGVIITAMGVFLLLISKYNIFYLGRLPGDIFIEKKNFSFYFPLASSIIVSIFLSIIVYFISKK
ncbi:MAG: DUF2905 domain-containing protein [Candidatus Omnitrophota bacterium]